MAQLMQKIVEAFTVSSANATAGAVYSNGGVQFTVLNTISSKTALATTSSAVPVNASGTLTLVSGTGDSTITFSAVTTQAGYGTDPLNTSGFEGQSDYSEYAQIGIVGMPYDIAENCDHVSPTAYETIGLGLGIVRMPSYNVPGQFVARLPRANYCKLVISTALTATQVINMNFNGVAIPAITLSGVGAAALAASFVTGLLAIPGVATAVIDSGDGNNLTFDITSSDGLDCLFTNFVSTVENTGATITTTLSTTDVVLGVSMQTQGKEQDLGSLVLNYKASDQVNTMAVGRIWVFAETACNPNDPVYVRLQNGTTTIGGVSYSVVRGGLRNTSDSGTCVLVPNWKFWQGTQAVNNGLAVIAVK